VASLFSLPHVRAGAGVLFSISLGTGLALSFSDGGHDVLTYVAFYGLAGVFAVTAIASTVVIERRKREGSPDSAPQPLTPAGENPVMVKRRALAVVEELDASIKLADDALETGQWWPVSATGMHDDDWRLARDVLGDESADLRAKVAEAYRLSVHLVRMSNAAHGQVGTPSSVSDAALGDLVNFREAAATAQAAIRDHFDLPSPPTIAIKLDRGELLAHLRDEFSQSVLLEVGVENPSNRNLEGVNANVLLPVGLKAGDDARCDLWGDHRAEGEWAPPTPHRIRDEADEWKEYWNAGGLTLPSGSRIFAFKLHLTRAGDYPVLAKFWGGDLQKPIQKDAVIRVVGVDELQPGRDLLSERIYEGEQMLDWKPDAFAGDEPPNYQRFDWYLKAAQSFPPEFQDILNQAQEKKGSDWKSGMRSDLRALYDIRARVTRRQAGPS
jgi:hypothetical protein